MKIHALFKNTKETKKMENQRDGPSSSLNSVRVYENNIRYHGKPNESDHSSPSKLGSSMTHSAYDFRNRKTSTVLTAGWDKLDSGASSTEWHGWVPYKRNDRQSDLIE